MACEVFGECPRAGMPLGFPMQPLDEATVFSLYDWAPLLAVPLARSLRGL